MIKTFKFSINSTPEYIDDKINGWIKETNVRIVGLEITNTTSRNGNPFIYYVLVYEKEED